MPTLRLIGITCDKTQETRDEPYLRAQIDDGPSQRIWGPIEMNDGETRNIDWTTEFDSAVLLQLWEEDPGRDDHISNLLITPRDLGRGETRHLFSGSRARFFVTFEVVEEGTASDCVLELVELHCLDAQERTDEPYLTVNDRRVWGPVDMRTGDTQRVDRVIPIHERAVIELWEADPARSDRLGTHSTAATPTGADQSVDFQWGTNPSIDARYRLCFRVRRA